MAKILLVLIMSISFEKSFYDNTLILSNGASYDLSKCKGKKVLIVNIATASDNAEQIGKLEQLSKSHQSTLVIIAFPSNDFGNEPKSNNQLTSYLTQTLHVSFLVSQKVSVIGNNQNSIYEWIGDKNENGMTMHKATGDYNKYLIDETGRLIGIYAPSVDPLSDEMTIPIDTKN